MVSALPSITEETGLTRAVAMTPNRKAHSVGAVRNSHAEIPGGAGDDQFRGSGQPPEAENAAQQDRERQDLHRDEGQAQRGDLADQAEADLRMIGGAAQQLDEVEHRHQAGQREQHAGYRQVANWRTIYSESVRAAVIGSGFSRLSAAVEQAQRGGEQQPGADDAGQRRVQPHQRQQGAVACGQVAEAEAQGQQARP